MAEPTTKIAVIIGSTREGRFSEKPAHYIAGELKKRGGVGVELIDLRDWPLPFFDQALSPLAAKGNYDNQLAKDWAAKIGQFDGYIIVTPEYNHGYAAVLKNALDWLFAEWNHKPVGFVGYGNAGGARAIEQLRQVVIELQMVPIRSAIHIPTEIYMAVMGRSLPVEPELFKPLREGRRGDIVETFFNELTGLAVALKPLRA